MSTKLTDRVCRQAIRGTKRRELPDGGSGLYLVVQPSGVKSWALRYHRPGSGRSAKMTLGRYSESETAGDPVVGAPMTLAAARALAASVQRQRAQGHDPAALHAAARRAAAGAVDGTFLAAARRFVREHAMPRTRRWQQTARMLGLDPDDAVLATVRGGLAERWRDRPAAAVTAGDVYELVDECRRLGVPGLTRRRRGPRDTRGTAMHAALSSMFGWLTEHRVVPANPCLGVHRPAPPAARERTLSDDEIRWFWTATDVVGAPFGQLLRLLLITGGRLNEVARMPQTELSADLSTWSIPGARTKNKRDHAVPLPPLAREVLASVPRVAGEQGYVFSTTGSTPVSGFSKIKRRLDAAMQRAAGDVDIPPWRVHDLRRTAASGMARAGADLHVIERALNHVSGSFGGIVGVYQRHKYEAETRAALEAWANLLLAIVDPEAKNNVVPMRRETA